MYKMKTCAFFGHSMFVNCRLNYEKLKKTIEHYILLDFSTFLVGCYGEFDNLALQACLDLKENYKEIRICKVYANIYRQLKDAYKNSKIEHISYPVENLHYKRQISETNKYMVDDADLIICYIDKNITHSGALKSVQYAQNQNKEIVNLF